MQRSYETERLFLRILDRNDAVAVLDYYTRNKDFLKEWEPTRSEEFYTKIFQREQLENEFQKIHDRNSLRLWIYKKNDEKKIIGTISFTDITAGCFQSCRLGYKLDWREINHGYISEAIQKGIDIIFNDYGLHRIEANIMPKNTRSLWVVEKLGFKNEGLAKQYLMINGRWEDHIHMVLLNEK
ncbi:MAG: GNAT family N-acetyltransferase [Mobilitalea sp.]